MSTVETRDKQSSIEVSRNAKGLYMFSVKTYYNEEEVSGEDIVDRNKAIMDKLEKEFS